MGFVGTRGSGSAAQASSFTVGTTSGGATGNLMVLALGINETAASTPTVTSISVPAGETNAWVRLDRQDGPSANVGCHNELWAIVVGKPTAWGSVSLTVTLSGTDGTQGSAYSLHEFSGAGDPAAVYAAAGARSPGTTSSRTPVTSSASINQGDLALGCFVTSNANAVDNDTTNTTGGSWVTISRGSGPTVGFGYKVTTASAVQTYDPSTSSGTGANTNLIVAVPAPSSGGNPICMVI